MLALIEMHHPGFSKLLWLGLPITSGERGRVVLRRHPDPSAERRPAAGVLMAAGPDLAGFVEKPLTDLLPQGLPAEEADGVHGLDLDGAAAAAAADPQQTARHPGQPASRSDGRGPVRPSPARGSASSDCQYSGGSTSSGASDRAGRGSLPTAAAIFSICLMLGMRQLAGRSVISQIEHNQNARVRSAMSASADFRA